MKSQKRVIQSGTKFNGYFPKAKAFSEVIMKNGDVEDTVALCQKTILNTLDDTAKIAPLLQGNSLLATCQNIYDFIIHYIQYQYDYREGDIEAIERVRTPARTWADRRQGADCEDYAIFISSILMNLGIPHSLRIAKYDHKPNWQHIYIIVPTPTGNTINVDPVVDWQFNYEVPYTAKKDFPMPVGSIKSTGVATPALSGIPSYVLPTQNTTMKRGIDALEFQNAKPSGFGGLAGEYIDPSVDSNKGYFRHYAQDLGFDSEDKLYKEMAPKINWAIQQNAVKHGMYKYASIAMNDGIEAGQNALKQDIIKNRLYIFKSDYINQNPNTTLKLSSSNTMTTTATPSLLPATASFAGSDLLTKKNLMIAGGGLAALALVTVLLK